ncbi:32653_t:CDS:1, partial [Racocetra persica]
GNGKIKEAKKGKTRGLVLILKPHKRENYEVYFPETIEQEQQISVRQLIKDLLDKSQKLGKGAQQNDIYILRTGSKEREGKTGGPSSGIAHYLALYSALHKIPLPRNLGSTGTVEGERVGSIGGLRYKLEASVDNGIDTFILAEKNKKHKNQENSFDDIYPSIESKVKQVHFVSSVKEIEIALNEILNGAIKEKVHVCGKEPIPEKKPEKPERNRDPPINSEITSEQLLSLITELGIREKQGENQDFWEKLQMAYGKNPNYQEAVDQTKNLRQEYLGKLEKIQNNPGGRNPNQGKKIRKFVVLAGTAGGKKE